MSTRIAVGVAALLLLCTSVLFLYHLNAEPFQDYDEATYAEITAESLTAHNGLDFTFLHNEYFKKPPLLFWLTDTSHTIFSNPEFADRLPSALAGIATILAVGLVLYAATGSFGVGSIGAAIVAGGILATTSAFVEPSRQVRFDVLVSLFDVLVLWSFMRAMEDRRWFLLVGIFAGLAILAKGPIALFGLVAAAAYAAAVNRWAWLKDPWFWGGLGVGLLVIIPWHLRETLKFGASFWNSYLGNEVVNRVEQNFFAGDPTNADYLKYIFEFAAPWAEFFVLAVCSFPFVYRRMDRKLRATVIAGIAGVLAVIAVCFATQTKAFSYLIPLYPFMAITIAAIAYELYRSSAKAWKWIAGILFVGIAVVSAGVTIFNAYHLNPYYAYEVSLADQEKNIGTLFLDAHAPTFYVYNTTTLGSIMFYSHLVTPLWLSSTTVPPHGSYVLYQTGQLPELEAQLPRLQVHTVYQGAQLAVVEVD